MFVQTEQTPNPNTLKFLPGKTVSEVGPVEFTNKTQTKNKLIVNLLNIEGITMVFLGSDFITVKKDDQQIWKNLKIIRIRYYLFSLDTPTVLMCVPS